MKKDIQLLDQTFLAQFELFKIEVTLGSGSGWWSNVCDRHAFSPSPQMDAPLSMGCAEGIGGGAEEVI